MAAEMETRLRESVPGPHETSKEVRVKMLRGQKCQKQAKSLCENLFPHSIDSFNIKSQAGSADQGPAQKNASYLGGLVWLSLAPTGISKLSKCNM